MTTSRGMAQRGGSIASHLRVGKKIYSPLIAKGEADILVALELHEAQRWMQYCKKNAMVILLDRDISVNGSRTSIRSKLREKCKNLVNISYTELLRGLPDIRVSNIFILGMLSNYFGLKKECWISSIKKKLPSRVRENTAAFEMGRKRSKNKE